MQLRGLSLSNIRSFEHAELSLGPGTTLIVGDVGAGKTSLLYAVEMALFGVAEVDAGHLVRHGRTDAEVRVRLEDDEHRFEVSRKFRRVRRRGRESFEPLTITFTEDGRPTSYSATELRRRIIEIVGFPDNPNPQAHSDLWRWAIYVPQERMREILAADPEERLETVRKALGVERFRTAAENAASLASDLRTDARRRREESGRLAYWDEELSKALAEAEQLRVEEQRRATELSHLETELVAFRGTLAEKEASAVRVAADRRELTGLETEDVADRRAVDEASRRKAELEKESSRARVERSGIVPSAQRQEEARSGLAEVDRARRTLVHAIETAERELRALAEARAARRAAEKGLEDLRKREASAVRLRAEAERALETSASEAPVREPPAPTLRTLAEIDRALLSARTAEQAAVEGAAHARADLGALDHLLEKGVCPTCHREVHPEDVRAHRSEIAVRSAEAETARARAEAERVGLEEERRSRERFERAHERWAEAERHRAGLRQALSTQDQTLTELRAEIGHLSTVAAPDGGAESVAKETEARLAEQRAALEKTEQERSRWAAELEASARAEERLQALDRSLERIGTDLERLGRELAERAARATERGARLAELRSLVAGSEALEAELGALRAEARRREEELSSARAGLVRVETRREGLSQRVALAERGRADRVALVEEAARLEARAAWVAEPLRYHLLAMEKDLLSHAQASFDRSFSRFFAALIDDPAMIARTDSAFTPQVTLNGEATPAEALSGGERTSLALAFRLALAATVRSLGEVRLESLLLDEPTDGFSSEQVVRMGELLEELALPQVIVVSHEAQLSGIADRTVRVVKRDGRSILEGGDPEPGRGSLEPSEAPADPETASELPPPSPSVGPRLGSPRARE